VEQSCLHEFQEKVCSDLGSLHIIFSAICKLQPFSYEFSAVGCAALHDRLYVCGGYDGTSSLNTVECFYPEKNDWMMVTPMMKHRSAAGVVAFQGFIYAIGGHDGLSIFDSVRLESL